jgi:hypothetical protein
MSSMGGLINPTLTLPKVEGITTFLTLQLDGLRNPTLTLPKGEGITTFLTLQLDGLINPTLTLPKGKGITTFLTPSPLGRVGVGFSYYFPIINIPSHNLLGVGFFFSKKSQLQLRRIAHH